MADIYHKICNWLNPSCPSPVLSAELAPQKPEKLPMIWFLFSPYRFFVDALRPFFAMAFIYGGLISILSVAMGFPFLCSLSPEASKGVFCSSSSALYTFYFALKLVVIFLFIDNYQNVIAGRPFELRSLYQLGRRQAKTALVVLGFMSLFLFPLGSFLYLNVRQPNPDWSIEVLVFGFFFFLFILPLFALRLLSLISSAALGESLPSLRLIWQKTAGSNIKILFSLFLMLFLFVFLSANLLTGYAKANQAHPLYISFITDFIYNFLIMMVIAWFVGLCYALKIFISGEKCHG